MVFGPGRVLREVYLHHVRRRGAPPLWSAVLLVDNVGAVRTRGNERRVCERLPIFATVDPRAGQQRVLYQGERR